MRGPEIDALSLDGRIAFSSATDDVYVIDADGSSLKRVTRSGDLDFDPTWSPDGSAIAFMAQTPEGTDNYEIFMVNVDGSGLKRLTHSPGPDGCPAWSPDGRHIVFSSVRDDCAYSEGEDCLTTGDIGPYHPLYIMGSDGSGERRLTRTFGQFSAWSPDGAYILFAGYSS